MRQILAHFSLKFVLTFGENLVKSNEVKFSRVFCCNLFWVGENLVKSTEVKTNLTKIRYLLQKSRKKVKYGLRML